MKKGIIFFLLSLFLLFTIKGKTSYSVEYHTGFNKTLGHYHTSKKVSNLNSVKSSGQQEENMDYLSPDVNEDLQISDVYNPLVYASILGFCSLLILFYQKQKLLPYLFYRKISSVKTFILIRSLRI